MCTSPNFMFWHGQFNPDTGKPKLHFSPGKNYDRIRRDELLNNYVEVPCGKCVECKQNIASLWSDRLVFESMVHESNYFITLTYDDLHYPLDGCLHQEDMQLFLHRLRKRFKRQFGQEGIRYFYCGEYGGTTYRCHFHLILFNIKIPDLTDVFETLESDGRYHKHLRPNKRSSERYSRIIYDLWQNKGMVSIDEFNYNTAAYVAGYVNKKVDVVHEKMIKKLGLTPEFHRQSNRPGIGAELFDPSMFDKSFLIIPRSGGAKHSQPSRYYEKLLDRDYPWLYNDLCVRRYQKKLLNFMEYRNSPENIEIIMKARDARNRSKGNLRDKI